VLLAMKKRGFGVGKWNGVGGKLETSETVEQAVVRECHEEIGVTPTKFHKQAEIVFDEKHKEVREVLLVHVFLADKWQGEPIESEEMAPKWFPIDKIPLNEMWDDDKYWLKRVLSGEKLKCKFVMDDSDRVAEKTLDTVNNFDT